jgi:hypothetical protein
MQTWTDQLKLTQGLHSLILRSLFGDLPQAEIKKISLRKLEVQTVDETRVSQSTSHLTLQVTFSVTKADQTKTQHSGVLRIKAKKVESFTEDEKDK